MSRLVLCPNYEVVVAQDRLLLTFAASDVPALLPEPCDPTSARLDGDMLLVAFGDRLVVGLGPLPTHTAADFGRHRRVWVCALDAAGVAAAGDLPIEGLPL